MKNLVLVGILAILSLSTHYFISKSNQLEETLNDFSDNYWVGFTFTSDFTSQDFCLSTVYTTSKLSDILVSEHETQYNYQSYGQSIVKHKSGNNVYCSQSNGNYKIKEYGTYNRYGFAELSPVQFPNNIMYGQNYQNQNQLSAQQGIGNKGSELIQSQESLWLFNILNNNDFGLQIQGLLEQNIEPISDCQSLQGRWKGQLFTSYQSDQANCVTQVDLELKDLGNQEFFLEGKTNGYQYSHNTDALFLCPDFFSIIYGHCEGSENKLILGGEKGIGFATEKFIFIQKEDSNLVLIKE